jgi:hypothetical protein
MSFLPDLFVTEPFSRARDGSGQSQLLSVYTADRRVVGRVGWMAITSIACSNPELTRRCEQFSTIELRPGRRPYARWLAIPGRPS